MPNLPLTTGQVELLEEDNVASANRPGLRELGIEPASIEEILPSYIGRAHAATLQLQVPRRLETE